MNRNTRRLRVYQGFVLVGLIVASLGCNPMTAFWMLNSGDKTPPQYPMPAISGKKNVTVAVVATANPALSNNPAFAGIDRELAQQVGQRLVEETIKEKKPVVVIDQSKISQLRSANPAKWDINNRAEIAKQLGADYLIEIHITDLVLHNHETGREVFHGKVNMTVNVYDANVTGGAKHDYSYTAEPPLRSTGDMNSAQYRSFLVKYAAKELAIKHVPHTPERDVSQKMR